MKQYLLVLLEILNPPMENYVTPPRTEKVIVSHFNEKRIFLRTNDIFRKILGWKRVGKTSKNHFNGDMARIVDEALIIGEFLNFYVTFLSNF